MLPPTRPPHNIILFELDLNVKFHLLHFLQFLSDLKVLFPSQCHVHKLILIFASFKKAFHPFNNYVIMIFK